MVTTRQLKILLLLSGSLVLARLAYGQVPIPTGLQPRVRFIHFAVSAVKIWGTNQIESVLSNDSVASNFPCHPNWDAVAGADFYKLYWGTNSSSYNNHLETPDAITNTTFPVPAEPTILTIFLAYQTSHDFINWQTTPLGQLRFTNPPDNLFVRPVVAIKP